MYKGSHWRSTAAGSVGVLSLAGREAAVLVELDVTRGLQLVDDGLGLLVLGHHLVVVGQLLLSVGDACELDLGVLLLDDRFLLVGLDLSLRASALGADLEHVGAGATVHYTFESES
jgi:hypothetical protein